MRDYNNAIYDYTKILEKDTNTGILCKRGECYYYTGNYIKALADLSSVIEEDPYNDGAYYLRGSVYIALSDFELALSDFTQSVNLLLNNAKAYIRRAYVQSYLGNHTEALKDLETAKEIEPSSMELYRTYGVVFLHMHMKAKAAEYLKIAAGMGDKASQSWLKKKGFTLKEYGQV
jgi:tetratricopeptide (TPR) repeat protein